MPLAESVGAVAALPQHLGERRGARLIGAAGVVETGVEVGEVAHADRVVVASGQQQVRVGEHIAVTWKFV